MLSKISSFLLLFSLSFLLNFQITSPMQFQFNLNPEETRCFSEFLTSNTHAVGFMMIHSSIIPHFSIMIYDEINEILFDKKFDKENAAAEFSLLEREYENRFGKNYSQEEFHAMIKNERHGDINLIKFAFSALNTGLHFFCLQNHDIDTHRYEFQLKTGIEAKDYSQILKKKNLQPTEKKILMIYDYLQKLRTDSELIWVQEAQKVDLSEKFNNNLVWTSIITIVMVCGFALFQYFVMRRFFKEKKLI